MPNPDPHTNAAPSWRGLQALLFFSAVLALFILQSLDYYLEPVQFGKDCAVTFQSFYGGERPITAIYMKSQGYFSFVMFFLPWVFAHLPTIIQPSLYTLSATAFMAVPATFVLWSTLFRQWQARWLFAVVLAFWHYWANGQDEPGTMYIGASMSFWPVCVLYYLLLLQMLADRHQGRRSVLLAIVAVPALLSHPYTIAALPALIYLAARRGPRATRLSALGLILLSGIYATTHVEGKSDFLGLLRPGTILDYIQYLVSDIALFGYTRLPHWAALLLVFLAVGALTVACRRRPSLFREFTEQDAFIFVFIAGISLIYFASYRYEQYGNHVPLRYSFVQQNLWLLFLLRCAERLPLTRRPLRLRAALWLALTVALLLVRGAGTPSSYAHLHDHVAAISQDLFTVLDRFETLSEQHPDTAFLVFSPGHSWPSRNFFVGNPDAPELINFNYSSREPLMDRMRALGASESMLADIRRAHERYGVAVNLIQNGNFETWNGDTPAHWEISGQGEIDFSPAPYGLPPVPIVHLERKEPESTLALSQVIDLGHYAPGAILRLSAQTRMSDGTAMEFTLSAPDGNGWNPIAERTGGIWGFWLRLDWVIELPDGLQGKQVKFSALLPQREQANWAQVSNVRAAVMPPPKMD